MFVIEDELHAEHQGEFADRETAMAELERRAQIPWDQPPNVAPCTSWRTCGRNYELVQYDDKQSPWRELDRIRVLEISAAGIKWAADFGNDDKTRGGKSPTSA
jgi:hypothetical protein